MCRLRKDQKEKGPHTEANGNEKTHDDRRRSTSLPAPARNRDGVTPLEPFSVVVLTVTLLLKSLLLGTFSFDVTSLSGPVRVPVYHRLILGLGVKELR